MRDVMGVSSAGERRKPTLTESASDGEEGDYGITGRSAESFHGTTRRTQFLAGMRQGDDQTPHKLRNAANRDDGPKSVKMSKSTGKLAGKVAVAGGDGDGEGSLGHTVRVRNKHGKVVDAVAPALRDETEEDVRYT